ncbi:uncharacterized protein DS421_7g206470 [Arachis hypogaea]|nr:uncharacterized protein DS421_7g206470 [Arachis hypogaea]
MAPAKLGATIPVAVAVTSQGKSFCFCTAVPHRRVLVIAPHRLVTAPRRLASSTSCFNFCFCFF